MSLRPHAEQVFLEMEPPYQAWAADVERACESAGQPVPSNLRARWVRGQTVNEVLAEVRIASFTPPNPRKPGEGQRSVIYAGLILEGDASRFDPSRWDGFSEEYPDEYEAICTNIEEATITVDQAVWKVRRGE